MDSKVSKVSKFNDESDDMTDEKYTFKIEDVGPMICPFCYAKIALCVCQDWTTFSGRYEIVSVEPSNKSVGDDAA